jgi:hypothetical protein
MSAYLRQQHCNRETGTTVQVLDLAAPGSEFDPDGENRWATICCEHSAFCSHYTLRLAIDHAAMPSGWCQECWHLAELNEGAAS